MIFFFKQTGELHTIQILVIAHKRKWEKSTHNHIPYSIPKVSLCIHSSLWVALALCIHSSLWVALCCTLGKTDSTQGMAIENLPRVPHCCPPLHDYIQAQLVPC